MLPEGWRRSTLGQIARITSGGTPARAEPSYWGGSIPWVTTGEIEFNTITDTVEKITEAGLKNSSAKLFPPGTLLLAMYGQGRTRGQVAKLGIEATTNQNSAAILLDDGHDPDFYFQFLSWQYDSIRDFGHSGGVSHLNAGLLKQIVVPVAPVGEQQRIAAILSTWDRAINLTTRLLANSSKQRRALAQLLLSGERRLSPGSNWSAAKLGELIVESRVRGSGGNTARKLTVKLYGRGVVEKTQKRMGSESTRYYRRSAGQFIYSKLDFLNGAFGCVPEHLDGFESTLDLPAFDFNLERASPRWLLHHVAREEFYRGQLGLANGGRKARRVNPSDLLGVEILLPDLREQQAIADVIETACAEERNLEKQVSALRAQKSVLMADLLTGKRRVHDSGADMERRSLANAE